MGHVILEEGSLNDIGDAIRSKLGVETTYLPREMAEAIMSIETKNVIEGYLYQGDFYTDAGHTDQITGETGKLYIDLTSGNMYRWDGSQYVEVSGSLELGETADTAYRGDRGKVAYDHAQAKGSQYSSGLYKITTNSEGHVTGATAVQKSDITGLGIPAQDTTYTASSSEPLMDGTASAGSSTEYARADHRHPVDNSRASTAVATTSANGLMSSADKAKLDGIAENANAYVLPPATTDTLGGVKPDGETIAATDGIISAVATYESDGSTAGPIAELTAKGHAEQDSTTGKNLVAVVQRTSNGVTSTPQSDGSVILSGTSTDSAFFITDGFRVQSDVRYRVSVSGYDDTGITDYGLGGFGNGKNIIQSNAFSSGGIQVYAPTGTTFNNVRLYPQIELGSTPTDFEPYTGGNPSPSPDYPQEIQVARGRNLLPPYFENGNIDANGQNSGTSSNYVRTVGMIKVEPSTKYTVTIQHLMEHATLQAYVLEYTSDGAYVDGSRRGIHAQNTATTDVVRVTFPTSSTTGNVRLFIYSTDAIDANVFDGCQLELGSVATPYVPYGYVGMEVQGKNLLPNVLVDNSNFTVNADGSITFAKALTANTSMVIGSASFTSGVTYTLSGGISINFRVYVTIDGNVYTSAGSSVTFTPTSNAIADVRLVGTTSASVGDTIYPQLERGSEATAYEPYYHTTTPIPLPERGWVGSLPDGTADVLTLDGAWKVSWELSTKLQDLGELSWGGDITDYIYAGLPSIPDSNTGWFCDYYTLTTVSAANMPDPSIKVNSVTKHVYVRDYRFSTISAFRAEVSGHYLLHALATPVTKEMGYVDLPTVPEGASISIPELDGLGVRYHIGIMSVLAAYESRIAALEAAIAELATS